MMCTNVISESRTPNGNNEFDSSLDSKFSVKTKDIISNFFGEVGTVSNYIQSYINPEEYHGTYADYLGVKIEAIQDVYELCSKPDLDKETLVDPEPENLQIKNKSVSLEKNK